MNFSVSEKLKIQCACDVFAFWTADSLHCFQCYCCDFYPCTWNLYSLTVHHHCFEFFFPSMLFSFPNLHKNRTVKCIYFDFYLFGVDLFDKINSDHTLHELFSCVFASIYDQKNKNLAQLFEMLKHSLK